MTAKIESLHKALQWLQGQRDQFAYSASDNEGSSRLSFYKPLGELAMVLGYLSRNEQYRDLTSDLASWAWKQLQEGDLLKNLMLFRQDLWAPIVIYSWFYRLGFVNPELDRIVRYAADTEVFKAQPMVQYRRLELDMALEVLQIAPLKYIALAGTQLDGLAEPWILSADSAYNITHEIFYATDFGRKLDSLNADHRAYVKTWLPVWMGYIHRQSNWDVFGELVTVAKFVGEDAIYDMGCSLLLQAQHSNGVFPGPAPPKPPVGSEKEWNRSYFLDHYHTTFVGIIALA